MRSTSHFIELQVNVSIKAYFRYLIAPAPREHAVTTTIPTMLHCHTNTAAGWKRLIQYIFIQTVMATTPTQAENLWQVRRRIQNRSRIWPFYSLSSQKSVNHSTTAPARWIKRRRSTTTTWHENSAGWRSHCEFPWTRNTSTCRMTITVLSVLQIYNILCDSYSIEDWVYMCLFHYFMK